MNFEEYISLKNMENLFYVSYFVFLYQIGLMSKKNTLLDILDWQTNN